MTKREFLTAVAENESVSAEIREFAEKEIASMDSRNEKRRTTLTPKQKENAEISERILAALVDVVEPKTSSEIAEMVGIERPKASSLCGRLAGDGKLKVTKVKSTAKSGGKVNGYTLA